jgi:hypothetical protein
MKELAQSADDARGVPAASLRCLFYEAGDLLDPWTEVVEKSPRVGDSVVRLGMRFVVYRVTMPRQLEDGTTEVSVWLQRPTDESS